MNPKNQTQKFSHIHFEFLPQNLQKSNKTVPKTTNVLQIGKPSKIEEKNQRIQDFYLELSLERANCSHPV